MKIEENTKHVSYFVVCESHKTFFDVVIFKLSLKNSLSLVFFRRQRTGRHQFLRRLVSIQQFIAADFRRGGGQAERSFSRTGQGGFCQGQL